MSLTGKQKRVLKGRGQTMKDDAQLGKAGLTDEFVAHLNALLQRKELIKLRFTDLEGDDRSSLADDVAKTLKAELVSVLGRTMLLYKPNPKLERDQRIKLD
jgi:RNA-binding protein